MEASVIPSHPPSRRDSEGLTSREMGGIGCTVDPVLRSDTLQITSEILSLIARIDEFKGAWRALGKTGKNQPIAGYVSGRVIVGRRPMPWQIHPVVKQPQNVNIRSGRTEHHKVSSSTPLSGHVQRSNAWLDVFARSGAQNIRPTLQGLDGERNCFRVGAGLTLTEGLDRPLQDFNVVLFSLLTEPNRPNLSHAPAMALEATEAR